jgi:hypothetical protein
VTAQRYTFRWLQAKLRGGRARAGTANQADSRVTYTYMLPVNRRNPHYPASRESCARPAGEVDRRACFELGRHPAGMASRRHRTLRCAGRTGGSRLPRGFSSLASKCRRFWAGYTRPRDGASVSCRSGISWDAPLLFGIAVLPTITRSSLGTGKPKSPRRG